MGIKTGYAFYTREVADGLRDVVIISNVDLMPEGPISNWAHNVVDKILCKSLEKYEPWAEKRVLKVAHLETAEPKLSDYQLIQMCGLLPTE